MSSYYHIEIRTMIIWCQTSTAMNCHCFSRQLQMNFLNLMWPSFSRPGLPFQWSIDSKSLNQSFIQPTSSCSFTVNFELEIPIYLILYRSYSQEKHVPTVQRVPTLSAMYVFLIQQDALVPKSAVQCIKWHVFLCCLWQGRIDFECAQGCQRCALLSYNMRCYTLTGVWRCYGRQSGPGKWSGSGWQVHFWGIGGAVS